jgi:hypothetical protein
MDHAMPDRMNVGKTIDSFDSRLVRRDETDQIIQRCSDVAQRRGGFLARLTSLLQGDDRFATETFDFSPA